MSLKLEMMLELLIHSPLHAAAKVTFVANARHTQLHLTESAAHLKQKPANCFEMDCLDLTCDCSQLHTRRLFCILINYMADTVNRLFAKSIGFRGVSVRVARSPRV